MADRQIDRSVIEPYQGRLAGLGIHLEQGKLVDTYGLDGARGQRLPEHVERRRRIELPNMYVEASLAGEQAFTSALDRFDSSQNIAGKYLRGAPEEARYLSQQGRTSPPQTQPRPQQRQEPHQQDRGDRQGPQDRRQPSETAQPERPTEPSSGPAEGKPGPGDGQRRGPITSTHEGSDGRTTRVSVNTAALNELRQSLAESAANGPTRQTTAAGLRSGQSVRPQGAAGRPRSVRREDPGRPPPSPGNRARG